MKATKSWYRSATIWVNVASALAILAPIIAAQLSPIIGDTMALKVAAGVGFLNTIVGTCVRVWLTNTGITGRTDAPG